MAHQRKIQDLLKAGAQDGPAYERFLADNLCSLSISLETESQFQVAASAYSHGEFTVARLAMEGGSATSERTAIDIDRDGSARYALYIPLCGSLLVQQRGREEVSGPGTLMFLSTSDTFTCRKKDASDVVYFFLPQDFVDHRFAAGGDICGSILNLPEGLAQFLVETICALHTGSAKMTNSEFGRASRIVAELVVLALSSISTLRSGSSPVRSANLARVKRIIRSRCGEPDLRLNDIAKECGLSLRYLHNLFQDEGCTFREYLMNERLKHAHRLLKASSPATTRITDVGLASGFSNLSHFSAAFRKSFACSPRDVLLGRA